ncbi:nucleotidyltransferase domain-containing protein [Ramlibacter sp. 2FC]|uniref:type VII toxin-antitoxin system MntA family adenylyltransferase antitoxin n=1 Tax=Ramlibacter sp. 2FC TaxID=2502188 RepID=UPI0010F6CDC6|nr:nucleotidyltransferase domain-containing protein [Ramlibacter sp. 2FC]
MPCRPSPTSPDAALAEEGPVVTAIRAAWPDALAVYAFGSRVQGTARPDSDLDLAVLVPGYAEPLRLWELAGQLSERLGCEVDLLDLRAASTVMQHQVLTQGQRLWGQALEAGLFECFVLSEKLALDAARAGLVSDIEKKGKVYGR